MKQSGDLCHHCAKWQNRFEAMHDLRLLGPVRVEQNHDRGEQISERAGSGMAPRFRSRRTVALLGYLVVGRRPVAREQLARLFWPDEPVRKGRSNLRRELHNLAKILPDCWTADAQTICFSPSSEISVDIYLLPQLKAKRRWHAAAELLAGEFLEGIQLSDNIEYETWLAAEREQWRSLAEEVLTQACSEQIRQGRYDEALHYGRCLLQQAPWNEGAHQKMMRLLAWTGRYESALRQFELCRQCLQEELGVEPSAETKILLQRIRQRTLERPPTPPAFLAQDAPQRAQSRPVVLARERELSALNEFLEDALAGQGRVVFITGGPGRGKSALMDAFAQHSMENTPELLAARGNCQAYSGAGDPYAPFREALNMLTGDVEAKWSAGTISTEHARRVWTTLPTVIQLMLAHSPQLFDVLVPGDALLTRVSATEPEGAPWLAQLQERVELVQRDTAVIEQSHIYEQYSRLLQALSEERPLLLFIDDLQWVDAASVGLLFHLGRRLADTNCRILVVCAYRPTEIIQDIKAGAPLAGKIAERIQAYIWRCLAKPQLER